jgi:hypothetical protein
MLKISRIVRPSLLVSVLIASVLLIGGCASGLTTIAPRPPAQYEKLGPATGKATGSIGVLGTATNFIPMGLNSRVYRAYDRAVASVHGATGLIDVTLEESWFWWVLGTARTVTISGEAIREIKQ